MRDGQREENQKNPHEGHRKRVLIDFLERGFGDSTPPHKIIEMLLFFSIPRKDTNDLAHELVDRFGSISGILDAPEQELLKIKGITLNTVALFKLILPLTRIYRTEKQSNRNKFSSMDEICQFLLAKYIGYTTEVVSVTSFDSSGRMLGFDILGEGSVTAVGISNRRIAEIVLTRNAACAVMAHNHPGGLALPSREDITATETVAETLKRLNIVLLDHIIIAGDDYVSLAQSKNYRYIFENREP